MLSTYSRHKFLRRRYVVFYLIIVLKARKIREISI